MSILIAFIVFGILILIHEFGHFLLAKKNGICVTEFSIGMGPRIVSFVKGETRYSLKLVPFGGSCAMLGQDEELEEGQTDENGKKYDLDRSFASKGIWARISVIAAGPIFNFLLAFVLSLIVIGYVGADPAYITDVEKDSPAYEAGLQKGDIIKNFNGSGISVGREIYLENYVHPVGEDPISMTVERDGKKMDISLQPERKTRYVVGMQYSTQQDSPKITVVAGGPLEKAGVKTDDVVTFINGTSIATAKDLQSYFEEHPITSEEVVFTVNRDGNEMTFKVKPAGNDYYNVGFAYNTGREKVSALDSIKYSCFEIKYQVKSVVKSLGMLVTGKLTKDDVAGPVGIVDIISDTVNETKSDGWLMVFMNIMNLTICLSANLGVMNLLPLPALDGGRLVFLFIELVRGKPIDREKEGMVHFVGMVLLMILMVFIMFNDIGRLFRK